MNSSQNKLTVLGAYGSKYDNMHTTCFLINNSICIDAGNILQPMKQGSIEIEHIFLTHSHLDHILDIPFLMDITFANRNHPLYIWALEETIEDLKNFIMNWKIWPDFASIPLVSTKKNAIEYKNLKPFESIKVGDIEIKSIPANHTIPTTGYVINNRVYVSGDTINNRHLVEEVNNNKSIKHLIIDISFPKELHKIAQDSKHHSTESFKKEIKNIRSDVDIYIYHMKPPFIDTIKKELEDCGREIRFLKENDFIYF